MTAIEVYNRLSNILSGYSAVNIPTNVIEIALIKNNNDDKIRFYSQRSDRLLKELEAENQKLRLEVERLTAVKQELEPYANIGKAYVELDKAVHVQKSRNPLIYAMKQIERLKSR